MLIASMAGERGGQADISASSIAVLLADAASDKGVSKQQAA
jgi:hypothetical protein